MQDLRWAISWSQSWHSLTSTLPALVTAGLVQNKTESIPLGIRSLMLRKKQNILNRTRRHCGAFSDINPWFLFQLVWAPSSESHVWALVPGSVKKTHFASWQHLPFSRTIHFARKFLPRETACLDKYMDIFYLSVAAHDIWYGSKFHSNCPFFSRVLVSSDF